MSSLIEPHEALRTRLCDLEPLALKAPFIEFVLPAGLCSRVSSSCRNLVEGNGAVPGCTVPGYPVPLIPPPSSILPFKYGSTASTVCFCAGVLCQVACPDDCSPRFRSWCLGKLGSFFGLAADGTLYAGIEGWDGIMVWAGR